MIAGLHLVWAFSSWPLPDRGRYAEVVVGVAESDLPGTGLTLSVAALLAAAAVLVAGRGGALRLRGPAWIYRWGTATVAAVLMVRGLGGFVVSAGGFAGFGAGPDPYRQWDLTVYSPLCVLLGAAAAVVALRPGNAPTGPAGQCPTTSVTAR